MIQFQKNVEMFGECCVVEPFCSRNSRFYYRFPDPLEYPDIFRLWVKRAGNKKLFQLTEQHIYVAGKMCSDHFEAECFKSKFNLFPSAVPTLNIPENPNGPEILSQIHQEISLLSLRSEIAEQPRDVVQSPVTILNGSTSAIVEIGQEIHNDVGDEQEIIIVSRADKDEISVQERLERLQLLQEKFLIKRMCRICLESKDAKTLTQIQESNAIYKEFTLRVIIEQVVPELNLKRYPKSEVCSQCKNLLVSSFQLKEIWKETYIKLQEMEEKELEHLASQPSIVISDNETDDHGHDDEGHVVHDDHEDHEQVDYVVPNECNKDNPSELPPPVEPVSSLQPLKPQKFKTVTYFDHDYIDQNGVSVKVKVRRAREGGMCELCGLYFPNYRRMQRHTHRQHKTLICEKCGEVCEGFRTLAEHRRTSHKVRYKSKYEAKKVKLECHICSKTLTSKTTLKWHVLAHYNIRRQLQCHTCGKTLGNAQSLRVHLKRHTVRDKNVSCEQCGKAFYGKTELSKHMKSHSNVYHVCNICGRRMKHAHALRRHIRAFHLLMDTVCEICDRPYYKKFDLIKHKVREHGWHPSLTEEPPRDILEEALSHITTDDQTVIMENDQIEEMKPE